LNFLQGILLQERQESRNKQRLSQELFPITFSAPFVRTPNLQDEESSALASCYA
jgi:hypothetical protein